MRRGFKAFPGTAIGQINEPDHPLDLLTGFSGPAQLRSTILDYIQFG